MIQAKFIGDTMCKQKHRWECPLCRANKKAECRFSLSRAKEGKSHKCRFCKTELLLKKEGWKDFEKFEGDEK